MLVSQTWNHFLTNDEPIFQGTLKSLLQDYNMIYVKCFKRAWEEGSGGENRRNKVAEAMRC